MSRIGRPPKPVELRVLEGNPGKRPIIEPPKAPPNRPTCPAWLTGEARAEWRRVVPILDRLGLLTEADRTTLAAYCEAVSVFRAATEEVAAHGVLVKGRRRGDLIKNPALQVQRDASKLIALYSSSFGLSPSDRVRLLGTAAASAASPLEGLLA